jgi:hypothetical protein
MMVSSEEKLSEIRQRKEKWEKETVIKSFDKRACLFLKRLKMALIPSMNEIILGSLAFLMRIHLSSGLCILCVGTVNLIKPVSKIDLWMYERVKNDILVLQPQTGR